MRVGLNPMTSILIRRENRDTDTNTGREGRGSGWIYTVAAKKCQGLPGTTRRQEESGQDQALKPSEGVWPCPHLGFRLVASRNVREYISVVLRPPVCGALVPQPEETNTPRVPVSSPKQLLRVSHLTCWGRLILNPGNPRHHGQPLTARHRLLFRSLHPGPTILVFVNNLGSLQSDKDDSIK